MVGCGDSPAGHSIPSSSATARKCLLAAPPGYWSRRSRAPGTVRESPRSMASTLARGPFLMAPWWMLGMVGPYRPSPLPAPGRPRRCASGAGRTGWARVQTSAPPGGRPRPKGPLRQGNWGHSPGHLPRATVLRAVVGQALTDPGTRTETEPLSRFDVPADSRVVRLRPIRTHEDAHRSPRR